MEPLLILRCGASERMENAIAEAAANLPHELARVRDGIEGLAGRRVLFAVAIGPYGADAELCALMEHLRRDARSMEGSFGAIIIDGAGDLDTKLVSRQIALYANASGCFFMGKPMIEATGTLKSLAPSAKRLGISRMEAYVRFSRELMGRLLSFEPPRYERPNIMMLHSSEKETSNTLAMGGRVCKLLSPYCDISEICLRNGEIHDCRSCSYKTCSHFAKTNECFYGGSIAKDAFPALMEANALLLLCPNYNDALGANTTAFINRLTSLMVNNTFYDRYLYAIVVSGYSGSDIIAQQALGALCFNKTFMLPPRFCLMRTANDPGEAMAAEGTEESLESMARDMLYQLAGKHIV